MRILHVATLFTPDGEFGGPTRVAANQAAGLAARGHTVTLAGASRGYRSTPTALGDVTCWFHPAVTPVPAVGMAGITARGLNRRFAHLREQFDIVHLHMARDLVTLPATRQVRRAQVPYVLQCHGMIDPSTRLTARPVDRLFTVPALRQAARILSLTPVEDRHLRAVAGEAVRISRLTNGVPEVTGTVRATDPPEVLFLARLDARKRPEAFARVANTLLDDGVDARFTIVGPDSGTGPAVNAEMVRGGHRERLRREHAIASDDVPARIARASVYVLPSVDEPYPMSVLEAMSVGRPVVITKSCGLADAVTRLGCGVVVDHTEDALLAAIRGLLADPAGAAAAGARGREAIRSEFGMDTVIDRLESIYTEVVATGGSHETR